MNFTNLLTAPPSVSDTTAPTLRVAIVNEFFYPDDTGGTGAVLTELAEALRESRSEVEITVITSRNGYRSGTCDYAAHEEWNGIKIERVATPSANGKSVASRLLANALFAGAVLAKLIAKHQRDRFDVVLVGTAPPTIVGGVNWFRLLTGIPYVYIVYDLDPDRAIALGVLDEKNKRTQVLRALQKSWLNAAERVVVLGRCMKERVERTYNVSPDRISVIPIGANPEHIPVLPPAHEYRSKFGLTSDHFLLCYSGNFGRYHNFNTLLDVAARLRDTVPSVRFLLTGDGAQRAKIAARIKGEGLSNVLLQGFVPKDEYPHLLAAADVSVITLEPGMEGLCVPSKFYSILASGRPVLALLPEVCEVGRVVNEEQCGVCVEPGDEQGILKAILRLKKNTDETQQMGKRARQALCARFTTKRVAELYFDALVGAVRQPQKSRPSNTIVKMPTAL